MEDDVKQPSDEKRKIKFRTNILTPGGSNKSWVAIIIPASFLISASLSFISSDILKNASVLEALLIVFLIIIVGIVFDIIGIAVTAADEAPFHAMASRKMYGAKQAIRLIRNANKVSSICNDVIGDICGIISGTASAFIVLRIAGSNNTADSTLAGLVITGLVASITIGGKAIGKTVAIRYSNYIAYKVGVVTKFVTSGHNPGYSAKKRKRDETK